MNHGPIVFLGVFFALATSWFGFVLMPQLQIGGQTPEPVDALVKMETRTNWLARQRGLPAAGGSFGTLYPLLSKMRRENLVDYEWQESEAGPPRKYYHLTSKGRAQLTELNDYWREINRTIQQLER